LTLQLASVCAVGEPVSAADGLVEAIFVVVAAAVVSILVVVSVVVDGVFVVKHYCRSLILSSQGLCIYHLMMISQ